jgi:hypothetical protein
VTAIDTALPSLTLVKTFPYRGNDEEWSNTYFMTGDLPASPASWKALADAVIAQEKTLLLTTTDIVRAIGHQAGESVAVWSYDYAAVSEEVAGTYTASGTELSGDTANWLRWSTDQLTSLGKPIYLRSYFHPAIASASDATHDQVASGWASAAQAFGDAWIAGFDDGDAVLHHRAGPHGVVGLVAVPCSFTTTRTLRRRGRRPTTP